MEEEGAGILQSPRDVGNHHVGPGAKTVSFHLHGYGQSHGMIGSVQPEYAVDLDTRVSLQLDFAYQFGGRESDLGVALALQDFLVHFVVATLVLSVAAGSVDDNQAAGRARRRIEVNRPTLQREGSMHAIERSA